MVSGSARLMDATMQMFKLFFGSLLGFTFARLAFDQASLEPVQPMVDWVVWLGLPLLSITLAVLFKARKKDFSWILMSGFLGYSVSIWGVSFIGLSLGAFIGAFATGVFGNIFSQIRRSPALVVTLPTLFVLVPGSKVFIGLTALISGQEIIPTTGIGPQIFILFMSLVAGLVFANITITPRRSL